MERDTLVLRLTVTPATWHILEAQDPAFTVLAFAEEGKPPMGSRAAISSDGTPKSCQSAAG